MDLSARVMVFAGALAVGAPLTEGCEKNQQYSPPGAQEDKKVDKAYV